MRQIDKKKAKILVRSIFDDFILLTIDTKVPCYIQQEDHTIVKGESNRVVEPYSLYFPLYSEVYITSYEYLEGEEYNNYTLVHPLIVHKLEKCE